MKEFAHSMITGALGLPSSVRNRAQFVPSMVSQRCLVDVIDLV